MSGIPVQPTSRQEIWTLVRDIRRMLGVENQLYFDIIRFAENIMPKIFPGFVLAISTQEEMGPLQGNTVPAENRIYISENVYIGAYNGNGRDRFTIAHEVGHYFMHDERSIVFGKSNGPMPLYRDSEWQADVFAGELLAPSYLIKRMRIDEIHKGCAVSMACAEVQLRASTREWAMR